ncbi:hypothetical protein VNO77_28273 [Canavalia gladiata]|uniref:Uncharacterized protein n=1 Tax=Canavalia gladiata TaxID=3824 RepID=A0AAN9Q7Q1_CANGL
MEGHNRQDQVASPKSEGSTTCLLLPSLIQFMCFRSDPKHPPFCFLNSFHQLRAQSIRSVFVDLNSILFLVKKVHFDLRFSTVILWGV